MGFPFIPQNMMTEKARKHAALTVPPSAMNIFTQRAQLKHFKYNHLSLISDFFHHSPEVTWIKLWIINGFRRFNGICALAGHEGDCASFFRSFSKLSFRFFVSWPGSCFSPPGPRDPIRPGTIHGCPAWTVAVACKSRCSCFNTLCRDR